TQPEVICGFGDGQLGFSAQTNLSMPGGGRAWNLSVGDANRDGINDLVVADNVLSRLVLFIGAPGTGLGNDICALDVPGVPGAVAFGDLSGDGLDDLVVSAFEANRYVVITDIAPPGPVGGNGVSPCTYSSFDVLVPAKPSLAKVGDVTGDGLNDLVCCLAFNATMAVIPGLPGGLLGEPSVFDSTGLPLRPFIGDFDLNGREDVAALSGLGNRINIWFASNEGRLAGARSYGSALPTAAWLEGADFDGDGDVEVVTGSTDDTNIAIMGGDGRLDLEFTFDTGFDVYQLEAADLDGDGLEDLVVGVAGGVKLLRNTSTPGDYSFDVLSNLPVTIGSGSYPFGIDVVDYNADQNLDLVVCDYLGGGLHLIPGTSSPFEFGNETIVNVGGGPVEVVAADFTGDGLQDFAVSRTNQSDIAILENDGNGAFVETLAVPVGVNPNYLVTSDFNSDGRADLVVSNAASGTVSVLFGGSSGFTGADYPAGSAPTALLAEDLTGDGRDDILVASLQSGDFRVLVGDGNGGFPLLPSFPGTLGASDAVLQDMTGDGLPELLISSLVTDRVSLVRNIRQ
ncbi:MAG: VCBS repeat-containing protein, partial [Planctomycetota bacterium]|nr:VCBS repeat-containing protein [Planctomycetota bacterium]